jgi:hypothetical protein
MDWELAFKRRETAIEDEFKVAELPLGQGYGRQALGLSGELGAARQVSRKEILELPPMRWHCHCGSRWLRYRARSAKVVTAGTRAGIKTRNSTVRALEQRKLSRTGRTNAAAGNCSVSGLRLTIFK